MLPLEFLSGQGGLLRSYSEAFPSRKTPSYGMVDLGTAKWQGFFHESKTRRDHHRKHHLSGTSVFSLVFIIWQYGFALLGLADPSM